MLSTQQLLNFGDSNLDFFENNLLDQDDWRGITKFLYFQKVFFSQLASRKLNWQFSFEKMLLFSITHN